MNYIILDLESTCWEVKANQTREIIEIGAVKIDSNYKVVGEFNAFVKPMVNPTISKFCMELTSISQEQINTANGFEKVINDFQKWIEIEKTFILCSWGFYDKKQLQADCGLHKLDSKWLERHISLKHQFAEIKRLKRPIGMKGALNKEKIYLSGTHHRGIDDARNISQIFLKNKGEWKF